MKKNLELMKEIRKSWTINPVTRVHDKEIKKDPKKIRKNNKRVVANYMKKGVDNSFF